MAKLIAKIAFGGGVEPNDPDSAAEELEQAGFTVFRLSPEHEGRLDHELDDHLEAVIEGCDEYKIIIATMREVAKIVDPHGGFCVECGPLEPDHVPFDYLFGPEQRK
jgi:hypothetical protein